MVTNSLQSCWFQTWCISGRWHLRDSLLFFEFVPAAQEVIESRRSHCYFTMSGSDRWTRTSAAEVRSKRPHLASVDQNFVIHSMMMRRDTVRHQVDMLNVSMRKCHLDRRELEIHYHMKITWPSVQATDMIFKLTREWGRNALEVCMLSWDQTTCQVLTDIRCVWMLFPGSSFGAQNIENLMWPFIG